MAFSESVKDQAAFRRSGGRCECKRRHHSHGVSRCSRTVTRPSAEFHHVTAESVGGSNGLSNCEVLCLPCHKGTPSYGRH